MKVKKFELDHLTASGISGGGDEIRRAGGLMRQLIAIASTMLIAVTLGIAPRESHAHQDAIHARQDSATGLNLKTSRGVLLIEPWQDGLIHVRFGTPGYMGNYNPAVIAVPQPVSYRVAETPDSYTLSTPRLLVRVNKADANIAFLLPDGTPLLEESERDAGLGVAASFQTVTALYGLGQHQNGLLDYAGHSVHLQQANTDVAVPMMISPNGWGLLWNNSAVTDVDVAVPAAPHLLTIRSEAGRGIDYDFILGPEIDDIIRGYRWLTGDAPLMARWTWGMWQSKERYETQAQLVSIATRYRQLGIPIDAVIQDWQYWPSGQWGSHHFDPARYPDPAAMVRAIHELHVHTIISVWPRFDLGTANLAELDQSRAAFEDTFNNVYPPGFGRWYDPWNPKGREVYWSQIMRNLGVLGFDGWWLDADEAELGGVPGEMREQATAAGPGLVVTNSFPLLHTTAVAEGMRRDQPDKRIFILSRSAFTGQQRNAVITWSGDIHGDWETLRRQIPAALNFSLSGMPYWSNDIGGFFPKPGMSETDYAELFTRWHQFGVFNPMFRIHGTGRAKEIWTFDAETRKRLKQDVELRYRLLPYLYSTSWDIYNQQKSLMKALAFDFRTDPKALAVTDQYLFGSAFLVAPVLEAHAKSRAVYLPGTDTWFDFWTGQAWQGGRQIQSHVEISRIPVFVRAGSIVPLGPVKPYADAPSVEPLEVRVYPGRDGSFTLYDDAGDGYGYLRGENTTIALAWNDRSRKLWIGARRGAYPGMPATVAIKIVCAVASRSTIRLIRYDGYAREIALSTCSASSQKN
jgi:alpha-D-xyloside xylohydrolase